MRLVKEREPFAEYTFLQLAYTEFFQSLQVSHIRTNHPQSVSCTHISNKLLHFTCSLQHMAQSPCSMDNTKKLEPLYSSFFSLCNPHGLHTESRHPQYLSLLGGDNELKEGLIFSPGINLCEIIEHSGQGAKRPDVVLPLLHKVLKHLRRKEEGQEYQIFLLNPEL